MNRVLRYFYLILLILGISAQNGGIVFAMQPPRKHARTRMSATERRDLARARAASRRTLAEEHSRRSGADEDDENLALAISASLADTDAPERRMRQRSKVFVVEDDDDASSSSAAPEAALPEGVLFTSPDIDQLVGLQQMERNFCGIYALYFASVLLRDGARGFSEDRDRAAFNAFYEHAHDIRIPSAMRGVETRRHDRRFMYGQDELVYIANQLHIPCWVGDLAASFFDDTMHWRSSADLRTLTQGIRAGTAPSTCVIFNTGGHWITIFITSAKMYVVDSADAEGSRCSAVEGTFHDFVVQFWNVAPPAPIALPAVLNATPPPPSATSTLSLTVPPPSIPSAIAVAPQRNGFLRLLLGWLSPSNPS